MVRHTVEGGVLMLEGSLWPWQTRAWDMDGVVGRKEKREKYGMSDHHISMNNSP